MPVLVDLRQRAASLLARTLYAVKDHVAAARLYEEECWPLEQEDPTSPRADLSASLGAVQDLADASQAAEEYGERPRPAGKGFDQGATRELLAEFEKQCPAQLY